jgi:hypothetical protein
MQSTMRHLEQTSEKDPTSPKCTRQVPKVKVTRIDEPILLVDSPPKQSELNKETSIGDIMSSLHPSSLDVNLECPPPKPARGLRDLMNDFMHAKRDVRLVVHNYSQFARRKKWNDINNKSLLLPEPMRYKQRSSMEHISGSRRGGKLSFELQSSKLPLRPYNHSFGNNVSQLL